MMKTHNYYSLLCLMVLLLSIGFHNGFAQDVAMINDTIFIAPQDINGTAISLHIFDNDDLGTYNVSSIEISQFPEYGILEYNSCSCEVPSYLPDADFGINHFYDSFACTVYLIDTLTANVHITQQEVLLFVSCSNNCVWPGDADRNGSVDAWDLLPIGLLYGTVGTPRDYPLAATETNLAWTPFASLPWLNATTSDSLNFYDNQVNFSHADCNGDGLIDDADIHFVDMNYGRITNETINYNQPINDSDLGITIDIQNEDVAIGDTVIAHVLLDNPNHLPIYGLALSLSHNVVDSNTFQLIYPPSFLTDGATTISRQYHTDSNYLATALVRTNLQASIGSGVFGVVTFVMEDVLEGKTEQTSLNLHIERATIIDNNQQAIELGAPDRSDDSVAIVGIKPPKSENWLQFQQNDAEKSLQISWTQAKVRQIVLYDINGKALAYHNQLQQQTNDKLSLQQLTSGLYLVVVGTDEGQLTQKILVH